MINIKELKIISNNLEAVELFIENINNIIISNFETLYYFLNSFFDLNNNNVFIGNKKIENKNTMIINLLDYESICHQLELKKGSLLYDFIINDINVNVENSDIKEEIENRLLLSIKELNLNSVLNYDFEFDIDILKVIYSQFLLLYLNFQH